ncbi:hypothetical protein V7111_09510 [Neobacillus niacini]|uniref:hypothetical protein n=1 Tax=Neobacillus niacini TaxID=86668 RepID=UPI002FFDA95B
MIFGKGVISIIVSATIHDRLIAVSMECGVMLCQQRIAKVEEINKKTGGDHL